MQMQKKKWRCLLSSNITTQEEVYKKEMAAMNSALYIAYSKIVELQEEVSKRDCCIEALKEELTNWRITGD